MRLRRLIATSALVIGLIGGVSGAAMASEVDTEGTDDITIGPCTDAEVKVVIPTPYGNLIICVDALALG